jgi:hypothetical protein
MLKLLKYFPPFKVKLHKLSEIQNLLPVIFYPRLLLGSLSPEFIILLNKETLEMNFIWDSQIWNVVYMIMVAKLGVHCRKSLADPIEKSRCFQR